jgi:hypothetical protein
MAEIGEHYNPAARDITVETFRVVRRDQSVHTISVDTLSPAILVALAPKSDCENL